MTSLGNLRFATGNVEMVATVGLFPQSKNALLIWIPAVTNPAMTTLAQNTFISLLSVVLMWLNPWIVVDSRKSLNTCIF